MWTVIFAAIAQFIKSFFSRNTEVTRLQKEVKDVKNEATDMAKPTPDWNKIVDKL